MKRMTQTLDRIEAGWTARLDRIGQQRIDRIARRLLFAVMGAAVFMALFGLTWRLYLPGPIAPWWIVPVPVPVSWLTVAVPMA
jgi:hypothetical protein